MQALPLGATPLPTLPTCADLCPAPCQHERALWPEVFVEKAMWLVNICSDGHAVLVVLIDMRCLETTLRRRGIVTGVACTGHHHGHDLHGS